MNIRQKIRVYITATMLFVIIVVIINIQFNEIYLEVLKQLSLPLTIILGGYFATETVKNIKK